MEYRKLTSLAIKSDYEGGLLKYMFGYRGGDVLDPEEVDDDMESQEFLALWNTVVRKSGPAIRRLEEIIGERLMALTEEEVDELYG